MKIASSQVLLYSSTLGYENAWDFSTMGRDWTSATLFPVTQPATAVQGPLFNEVVVSFAEGVSLRYRQLAGEVSPLLMLHHTLTNPTLAATCACLRCVWSVWLGSKL
jgi:hypothetical protein